MSEAEPDQYVEGAEVGSGDVDQDVSEAEPDQYLEGAEGASGDEEQDVLEAEPDQYLEGAEGTSAEEAVSRGRVRRHFGSVSRRDRGDRGERR